MLSPWIPLCVLAVAFGILWSTPVQAQADAAPAPDRACRLCHAEKEGSVTLPSGETLPLSVDLETLDASVHGLHAAQPVYCFDCHRSQERYQYPHEPNPAQDLAEYQAEIAANCENCHTSPELHNPGHLQAQDTANLPNCVDCHGGHDVAPAAVMNANPIATCRSCHPIFEDMRLQGIHNEVLPNLGPDQSCETCHASTPQSADAKCQTCHSLLRRSLALPDGKSIDLHVNPEDIVNSMHGAVEVQGVQYSPLQCTDCHKSQAFSGYPHDPLENGTRRSVTLEMEAVCQNCHTEIYARTRDGVHAQAIAEGNLEAATCADCHGNHSIQNPDVPREHVSETCSKCHAAINDQYAHSVHGAALLGEDNPDVPVCTDCHGVHDIHDPTTDAFRLSSPNMCGHCHANAALMDKYGISTDVFDTYVADFHGTTVTLFERTSPDEGTNKAVCYDCHGVHNILPVTDEHSQVIKANLLTTCRQCHPDATENFPDSWTSHFKPSIENNTLVYLVDLFYLIVIPATIGGFVLFIGTDIFRRVVDNIRGRRKKQ